MRNIQQSKDVPEQCMLNFNLRHIVQGIQKLESKGLIYCHDELLFFVNALDATVTKEHLEGIYNGFDNFDNIELVKRQIIDCYKKEKITKKILEDILVNTSSAGELKEEKLKELGHELIYGISDINDNLKFKTAEDLTVSYMDILDKREKGIKQRSLGFRPLNNLVTRPAADGEMTGLLSLKGMAKSIFTKTIVNILINNRIPVLDQDLEMTEESSMDRLIAMRGGYDLDELIKKEKGDELKKRIKRDMEVFRKNPYYLRFDEPGITIDDMDALMYKAKAHFREKNILRGDDEYIFTTIDLLEMVEDFSGLDTYKVKKAINKLHKINKKHQSHMFFTLQANENKIRSTKFSKPEDLDYYKIGMEDVYGSDAYSGRVRLLLSLQRPKHLKYMFFPDRMEEWDLEEDIINCHCVKQNDGKLFFTQFVFDKFYKIYPRIVEEKVGNNE